MAVTPEFISDVSEALDELGYAVENEQDVIDDVSLLDDDVTLPGIRVTRGEMSGYVSMKLAVLYSYLQGRFSAIQTIWDSWFGTSTASGVQGEWEILKVASQTATTAANNAASAATSAITGAENVNAGLQGFTVTITDRNGTSRSVDIGFEIYRTYSSISAMNADAANVPQGKFVVIATIDPTSVDNAKMYCKNSQGGFTFMCDLDQASSAAWADWLNNMKPEIEDATDAANAAAESVGAVIETANTDHTRANNDHTTATQDHTQAADDHTTASSDHITAQSDHARAESDHSTASSDHTTAHSDHTQAVADTELASQDHTRAGSDHTIASSDHTTASNDHSNATQDHTTAGADHTVATQDHTVATQDHTTADSDHTRAGTDHSTASSDHSIAADDHSLAEEDHSFALADHDTAADDHTTASSDHTTALADHTTAGTDHSRSETDHTRAGTDHDVATSDHTTAAADHSTAGTDHTASTTATTAANTQANRAKAWADHPPYIGDGTTGDENYWYLWNESTSSYVKSVYAKGDDLDWEDMTEAEKADLVQRVVSAIVFDDAPTQGSSNAVKSGGVYTALQGKQDTLTFASTGTAESIIDELI